MARKKVANMTANEIQDAIMQSYHQKGHPYMVTNFQSSGLQECDVLTVSKSNLMYEFEVKRSRSDFLADFKKVAKHKDLKEGNGHRIAKWGNHKGEIIHKIANYFYFVSEEGIINIEDIPEYAGLIHVYPTEKKGIVDYSDIKIVKKAPKLHGEKASEKLIRNICHILSTRQIFGCSYMRYKKKLLSEIFKNNDQK